MTQYKISELEAYLAPFLPEAIEWLANSGIYSDDIRPVLKEFPVKLTYQHRAGMADYRSWSNTISYKKSMSNTIIAAIEGKDGKTAHTTYYLNQNDEYVDYGQITYDSSIMSTMIHELTHHIQRIRVLHGFAHKKLIHTVKRYNDPKYSRGTIKMYECETTYNEIAWIREFEPGVEIRSISGDKAMIDTIFANTTLEVSDYIWQQSNKTPHRTWSIDGAKFNEQTLAQLAEGQYDKSRMGLQKLTKIIAYRKTSAPSSSFVFFLPEHGYSIDCLWFRKMKINRQIGKIAISKGNSTTWTNRNN